MAIGPSRTPPPVRRTGLSLRTERKIRRLCGAVGIGILAFTLGGIMEGRGTADNALSAQAPNRDSGTSEPTQYQRADILVLPGHK